MDPAHERLTSVDFLQVLVLSSVSSSARGLDTTGGLKIENKYEGWFKIFTEIICSWPGNASSQLIPIITNRSLPRNKILV